MSTSETSAKRERPDAVTVLFIIFCFGAVTFFALFGFQVMEVLAGRDRSAGLLEVGVAIGALVIRSVGMVRLFLMKADCWLWLVAALVIALPITILSILNHRVLGHDLTAPVLSSIAQYVVATGVIYYAYRLFPDPCKA